MRRPLLLLVAVAVAIVVGDGVTIGVRAGDRASAAPAARTVPVAHAVSAPLDLVGQVVLGSAYGGSPADWRATAAGCTGVGAFAAVVGGAAVVVSDAAGRLVSTTLAAGRVVVSAGRSTCSFAFHVAGLAVAARYVLVVGGLQPVSRPYADLAGGVLEIDPTP